MTGPLDQVPTAPTRTQRLFRLLGAVFGLAAASYFLVVVVRTLTLNDVKPLLTGQMLGAIAFAAAGYALVIPTTGWAWGKLLRDTGVMVPTLQLSMIIGVTQIAKYLPGNFAQHLSRSAMALQRGVPPGPLLSTLAAETVLAIGAAVVVGTVALLMVLPGAPAHLLARPSTLLLAVLSLLAALAIIPRLLRRIPPLAGRLVPALTTRAPIQVPRVGALSAASAAYLINYFLGGAALYWVASTAAALPPSGMLLCIGAFAVSWVTGFVVPGAPAGLGVREGVMFALLAPALDAATAAKVVIAFRIVTTLGDVVGLIWGASILLTPTGGVPASRPHGSLSGGKWWNRSN